MRSFLDELRPQQRIFVVEYLRHWKVGKAAQAAGVTAGTGSSWLSDEAVQRAVAEQMELRIENTKVDANWVLVQLKQMFDADLGDIINPDTNDLRPIHEWPEVWRKMVSGVKINALYEGRGDERELIGYVKDIKIMDRLKAVDMIGKHTDVGAWVDRVEVTTDDELNRRLMSGRKRAFERNKSNEVPTADSFL